MAWPGRQEVPMAKYHAMRTGGEAADRWVASCAQAVGVEIVKGSPDGGSHTEGCQ